MRLTWLGDAINHISHLGHTATFRHDNFNMILQLTADYSFQPRGSQDFFNQMSIPPFE